MACWRQHFPLLCVKQWHADIITFHCCVSHNVMLMSALSIVCLSTQRLTSFLINIMEHVETDSVWRVIEGKWCFGSGIRIHYPDHHQNLMEWSLGSWLPSHYISFKSVHNFLSNPANRQTDRQTRQTDRQTDERALGECILCKMLAFYICDWHWLVENLRRNQFGPNSLNERCIMILFMMKYYYNSRKYVTLTFEIWPWLILTLIFDFEIDILLPWCFEKELKFWKQLIAAFLTETSAQLTIIVRFVRYLVQIILFYTCTQ